MMLYNPLASRYAPTVVAVVVGLLGVSLVVLIAIARGDPRRMRQSSLFRRWRVWAVIAPVYAAAALAGTLPLLVLVIALTTQGLREYATLVGMPRPYRRMLIGAGLLAAPAAAISMSLLSGLLPLLFIVATLQPLFVRGVGAEVRHLAFAVLGWAYVAWTLAHLVLIERNASSGAGVIIVLGLATALSDVGAFTIGKSLGRHKLAPLLSPNKTWEGVAGNVIGAAVGIILFATLLPAPVNPAIIALLSLTIGLGALWGDLLESSIKREFAVKDAGSWLPGFGGLLDRIDSLIIVAPLTYYALQLSAWRP